MIAHYLPRSHTTSPFGHSYPPSTKASPKARRLPTERPVGRAAAWQQILASSPAPGASRLDHGKHVCRCRSVHGQLAVNRSVVGGWTPPQLRRCC